MKTMLMLLLVLLMLGMLSAVYSQPATMVKSTLTPIEKILNRDGTVNLKTGFNGSLDLKGWRMTTNTDGKPVFTKINQPTKMLGDDDNWSTLGSGVSYDAMWPGWPATVYALAVIGTDLYVGGTFDSAGGVYVKSIARWDGTNWFALGSGLWSGQNIVFALAVIGTELYVGGTFGWAGGVLVDNIAKWDGSNWSALGSGMNDDVRALAVNGTDLYAGGAFTTAGDVSANRIAKWDGSNWSALGSGVIGQLVGVGAIKNMGSDVYVGGDFYLAGGKPANGIARWSPPPTTVTINLSIPIGWNMLSLPVSAEDRSVSVVFPDAQGSAFGFRDGYSREDTIQPATGYWLKFNDPQILSLTGSPIKEDSFNVVQGWNIIGSISSPVDIDAITSDPPGMTVTRFLHYNTTSGMYETTDSIRPGLSYWVRTSENGKLYISSSTMSLRNGHIQIVLESSQPPPPPSEEMGVMKTIPKEYALEQNHPNPFNPVTRIRYQLPVDSRVSIKVYNMLGQEVAILVNEMQDVGYKYVEWNAGNYPSGIYVYRMSAEVEGKYISFVKKLLLVK